MDVRPLGRGLHSAAGCRDFRAGLLALGFVIFGRSASIWAVSFYAGFATSAGPHELNAAELALLGERETCLRTWKCALGQIGPQSRSIWLLWAQYFCLSYPLVFLHHLAADVFEGTLPGDDGRPSRQSRDSSAVLRRARFAVLRFRFRPSGTSYRQRRSARKLLACVGFFGAAALMFISTTVSDALVVMVVMGFASFCNDLIMPGAWASCMDIGGKYAGTVSGSMNMMGNLAASWPPF